MALEPITRQEQIIAGKDLEPITRMEKFLKEYGGGGGASSWNDLDDRPFGEETVYGDTLTWDGNTEGREVFESSYYHVSDMTPSNGEVLTGTAILTNGVDSIAQDAEIVRTETEWLFAINGGDTGFIILANTEGLKPGVYLRSNEVLYVASLTINGYNGFPMKGIKQLDNKYLEPFETVGGDTLTWDGNTEGLEVNDLGSGGAMLFYKVSSATPALEDFANGGKLDFFDGGVAEITQDMLTSNNGAIFDTEMTFIIAHENEMGLSKGVWFKGAIALMALTINGYTGFTTTKLKEEYIPVDYIKQLIAEVTGK